MTSVNDKIKKDVYKHIPFMCLQTSYHFKNASILYYSALNPTSVIASINASFEVESKH
jgi:hypothetical protein